MGELQNMNDGQKMTSREIAEITGKLHHNVIRDIKKLEPAYLEAFTAAIKFDWGFYKDANNQKRAVYNLTKSQALFIVSGYNPTLRAKIQARFEELEKQVAKPKVLSRLDLIKLALVAEEENEVLRVEAEENKPKVEAFNTLMSSKDNVSFGEFSKAAGIGRNTLFEKCRESGILIKKGDSYNLPKQYQINLGRFVVQENTYTVQDNKDKMGYITRISFKALITPKGQAFIIKKLKLNIKNN